MEVNINGAVIKLTKRQIAKIEKANSFLQYLKIMKEHAENNPAASKFLSAQVKQKRDVEALSHVIDLVAAEKYK